MEWSGPKGCVRSNGLKSSLHCLPGPWMMNGGRSTFFNQSFECKGIHPYPLFFSSSQPLISGVKYLLSLRLLFTINEKDLEIPVETIWGFQGTMFENRQKKSHFSKAERGRPKAFLILGALGFNYGNNRCSLKMSHFTTLRAERVTFFFCQFLWTKNFARTKTRFFG